MSGRGALHRAGATYGRTVSGTVGIIVTEWPTTWRDMRPKGFRGAMDHTSVGDAVEILCSTMARG
jgi:hypothetical protein